MSTKSQDCGRTHGRGGGALTALRTGNGDEPKPFKGEWATVKDGVLWVGSVGKEWVVVRRCVSVVLHPLPTATTAAAAAVAPAVGTRDARLGCNRMVGASCTAILSG